jgi:predicted unusual protein kinase regulating ubiquinone biosynthesis (AarF/ABC1/UbiB family)
MSQKSDVLKPLQLGARFVIKRQQYKNNKPLIGKWLKNELLSMGPIYIKLGQIASTRQDLFPSYITNELSGLQSNVPTVSFDEMNAVFYSEFDTSLIDYFKEIDTNPIASASIAQVYKATMKNGKDVVVKIQKPLLKESMTHDLEILQTLTDYMKYLKNKQMDDLNLILNECSNGFMKELEFTNEMKNMQIFRSINQPMKTPRVFSKVISNKVLIMEYVPGINANEINDLDVDKSELANNLMLSFIQCLFETGYLHADPHPGNIAFTKDGTVILYDYGIIARFDKSTRDGLRNTFKNIFFKDINGVIDSLLQNEIIYLYNGSATSYTQLSPYEYVVLYSLTSYVIEYTTQTQIDQLIKQINDDPFIKTNELPFYINSKMILLFKSLTTLEGVCKSLNPDFSYTLLYMDIIQRLIGLDFLSDRITYDMSQLTNDSKSYLHDSKMKMINENINSSKSSTISILFFLSAFLHLIF